MNYFLNNLTATVKTQGLRNMSDKVTNRFLEHITGQRTIHLLLKSYTFCLTVLFLLFCALEVAPQLRSFNFLNYLSGLPDHDAIFFYFFD